MPQLTVSKRSLDMIVGFEVSSPALYEKKYRKPVWPGGASGVTIGIGYDLGYYSAQKITNDWEHLVDKKMLQAMCSVSGRKGQSGRSALEGVKDKIDIPYAIAAKVFIQESMPQFAAQVLAIYPGVEKLPPDAQGALLSLVYNRGSDVNPKSDRRREMARIAALVAKGDLSGIAAQIRAMKRLWPDVRGLRDRRDKEAGLVENAMPLPESETVVIVA